MGAEGNSKLLIQHGGRLRELSLTGHLRPEGVRIRPGSPHRIVEQQVEMRVRLFREIAPFLEGERVYLFGSFRLARDRDPRQRVDAVNPVRRFGDLLRLEYASFQDLGSSPGQALEEQGRLVAPIEEGTLLVKFIDRLRKLKARQEKLAGEVEVRANFSGRVLGMEARHEADHVRVDLTVTTERQGSGETEALPIPNP